MLHPPLTQVTHEFRYYFSFCYCNIVWEDCCAVKTAALQKVTL